MENIDGRPPPLKIQLIKRILLPEIANGACAFYHDMVEDELHLFKYCVISKAIWNNVFSWLGIEMEEGNCSLEDYLNRDELKMESYKRKIIFQ